MSYLEESIDNQKDALQLIIDIAIDYDGYRKAKSLMELIDELKKIAKTGLNQSKDKETMEITPEEAKAVFLALTVAYDKDSIYIDDEIDKNCKELYQRIRKWDAVKETLKD